jgi:acyl-CoA reductase-like NAD-dependent aldehyde dehydrogenase
MMQQPTITRRDHVAEAVALHDQARAAWDDRRHLLVVELCRRALELLERHAGPLAALVDVLTLLGRAEHELGAHHAGEAHLGLAAALAARGQ